MPSLDPASSAALAAAHRALVERLYAAFSVRDGAGMTACYHGEATFSDPVFPLLRGSEVGRMWRMLCRRAEDLAVEASGIQADQARGRAHWEARYTFSATGRAVHNVIDATFEFRDGLIVRHVDAFDFHAWAGQALGLKGRLLGGTAFLCGKVQRTAAAGLARFER
jgi:ketosteroid isomerase-like protein